MALRKNWSTTAAIFVALILGFSTAARSASAAIGFSIISDIGPVSSLEWPFVFNELKFWDGSRWVWVNGTNCFSEPPQGCADANGDAVFTKWWNGSQLAVGYYLLTIDASWAGYEIAERSFYYDGSAPVPSLGVIFLERIDIVLGSPVWWVSPPKNKKGGPIINWGYSVTNIGNWKVKVETFTMIQNRGPGGYAIFPAGGKALRTLAPGASTWVEDSWELSGATLGGSDTYFQVQVHVPGDPTNLFDVTFFAVPTQ